jgi:hypothetical protein
MAILLIVTFALGSLYILYLISLKLHKLVSASKQVPKLPAAVSHHINTIIEKSRPRTPVSSKSTIIVSTTEKGAKKKEFETFGAYFGDFAEQITPNQARVLQLWDVIVLDAFAQGVPSALRSCPVKSTQILGRVDLCRLTRSESSKSNNDIIAALDSLSRFVSDLTNNGGSCFTGILLAGFPTHFEPLLLNKVVTYIKSQGMDVWLEFSGPDYLPFEECLEIDFHSISGVVYRNATIRTDGLQQNVHQMEPLRATQRGIARQKVLHGPPMMLLEVVDNEATLDYAVCQRSFSWCRYNSAIPWIGRQCALYDADLAIEQAVLRPPLGALMWLKDEDNMKAHDYWRLNHQVSAAPCNHDALYQTLDDFVPGLADKLTLLPPIVQQSRVTIHTSSSSVSSSDISGNDSMDEDSDALSVSVNGTSFTGMGCFQLGQEATFNDFTEIVTAQRSFKDLNLLKPLTSVEFDDVIAQVQALLAAIPATQHTSTTYQATRELLDLLLAGVNVEGSRLSVYVGLNSGFRPTSKIQYWGLYDINSDDLKMDIFLSKFSVDLPAAIVHTFLSSRGLSRSECLLAEITMVQAKASRALAAACKSCL